MYILVKGDESKFEAQLQRREKDGFIMVGSHCVLRVKDQYNNYIQYSAVMIKSEASMVDVTAEQFMSMATGGSDN